VTKYDYFVLPPSGDLYAYPTMMDPTDQASFVANTERDCVLMNTSATVAWEFADWWPRAIQNYFPRYTTKAVVHSFFSVNVPFSVPIEAFGKDEYFKTFAPPTTGVSANDNDGGNANGSVAGEPNVVLFRPREWRSGPNGGGGGKQEYSAVQLANEINGYPLGTVTCIYLTSDGGGNLDSFYALVPLLDEHVQVVNHNAVGQLALQSAKLK
jgi:hypothetical protein